MGNEFDSTVDFDDDFYHDEAVVLDICKRLETKYAFLGLEFTEPFNGYVPVQAWGKIHGMDFYFRFRHDYLSLRVGDFSEGKSMFEHSVMSADVEDYTGEPYNGVLNGEELFDAFVVMIDRLQFIKSGK